MKIMTAMNKREMPQNNEIPLVVHSGAPPQFNSLWSFKLINHIWVDLTLLDGPRICVRKRWVANGLSLVCSESSIIWKSGEV